MFKQDFKYYKSKNPPPDFDHVIDFNRTELFQKMIRPINCNNPDCDEIHGLKPPKRWQAYELTNNPGLIFIRNPFTTIGQKYWIVRCLRDYPKRPNKLNIDVHNLISTNQDWWQACQETHDGKLLKQLRWATLGYHHNWDTKEYSEDLKNDFPSDLARLSTFVASAVGFNNFKAEAAIVNYYHMDSTLSGHTDHSELFLEAPLLSFSFGQSAIFLLGGPTLEIKPSAMFLRSGDIVIMSRDSRLSYHGIPRIVKEVNPSWNLSDGLEAKSRNLELEVLSACNDENVWKPFSKYLEDSRININVRQVLPQGKEGL